MAFCASVLQKFRTLRNLYDAESSVSVLQEFRTLRNLYDAELRNLYDALTRVSVLQKFRTLKFAKCVFQAKLCNSEDVMSPFWAASWTA